MSLKLEFVERASKPHANIARLCREYGISRETGYKWLRRYQKQGYDGLQELSRRPASTPLATAEEIVLGVLQERERHPRWGAVTLRGVLEGKYGKATPSVATIARILRRAGKVRQRSRFRRLSIPAAAPRITASRCNEVWTVDYKGWWRSRDRARCEPLTVRDAFSRYVLAVKVMASPTGAEARKVFEALFRRYGVPSMIQCDNGGPFINVQARGGLTRLSAWWVSLGIKVLRSRPGCPQDNGAHERMHRDMAEDLQAEPAGSRAAQQRACDRWRLEFNHLRPHQALEGKVPAKVYKRSERRMRVCYPLYPSSWIVRRVTENGNIKIQNVSYAAGKALSGQRVALQVIDEWTGRLWYFGVDLGTVKLEISDSELDQAAERFFEMRLRKTG